MGDRRMVFGDGLEDIKDCFLGSVSYNRGGDGGLLSRPVIIGSILLLWLFGLSVGLIVVVSKYEDLSVVALSSRLDGVEQTHSDRHSAALQNIESVDSAHRRTVTKLRQTADRVEELQGHLEASLGKLSMFLGNLGRVAGDASREMDRIKIGK